MMPLPDHPSAADVFTQAQLRMLERSIEALRDKGALARLTEEDKMHLFCARYRDLALQEDAHAPIGPSPV